VYATERNRGSLWLLAALSLLLALLANMSNIFIIGGVAAGPLALAVAIYPLWRGRGFARVIALVAAILAVAAFALSLALIYGLSHNQCPEAPGCPP
jgi:hypothetical protein